MIREQFNNQSSVTMAEIRALEQQIYQGGNVDSEKDQLKKITEDLNLQNITPEQALLAVQGIVEHRQDYH